MAGVAPLATAAAHVVLDGFYGTAAPFNHAIWPTAASELANLVPSLLEPPPHKHENVDK